MKQMLIASECLPCHNRKPQSSADRIASMGKTIAIRFNGLAFGWKTRNGPMGDGNLTPGLTNTNIGGSHGYP